MLMSLSSSLIMLSSSLMSCLSCLYVIFMLHTFVYNYLARDVIISVFLKSTTTRLVFMSLLTNTNKLIHHKTLLWHLVSLPENIVESNTTILI